MPYKEFKIEKLYYSIGEVAEMLGENVSLVRFWSDKFSKFVKPERNKKGNRRYSQEDIKTLKTIYYLVKEKGMTLEGAASVMGGNRERADKNAEIVERLTSIKCALVNIQNSLEE